MAPLADKARADRKTPDTDNPFLRMQEQISEMVTKGLEAFGQLRDQTQEAVFHAVYGSPWLQAWLGMTPNDGPPRPKPGTSPDQRAALAAKIEKGRTTMDQGGPFEAEVRALVYIAMGQRSIDARSFEILRRALKAHPDITLARYKAIVREQWARLTIDQEAALKALPQLLPADADDALQIVRRDQGDPNGGRRTRWGGQAPLGRDGGFVRHRGTYTRAGQEARRGESIMSDAIIVLNAGSSSLKFSIYGVADRAVGPCGARTD